MVASLNTESKLFIEFIKSFDKYLQPLSEISKNVRGPVVDTKTEMYNFDEICQNTKSFREIENYSRTTDAFFYKIKNNGELKLYFIEFKGDYLEKSTREKNMKYFAKSFKRCKNELPSAEELSHIELFNKHQTKLYGKLFSDSQCKKIRQLNNKFSDSLMESLELKPLESIFVALPVIYEDYLEEHDDVKDINMKNFLEKCEKEIWVVGLCDNRHREHVQNRMSDSYHNKIKTQYERLKMAKIFDDYAIEDQYAYKLRLVREKLS